MTPRNPAAARAASEAAREFKTLVAASGRKQSEIADYLNRRLKTDDFEHYHVSRMISGGKSISSDVMDAMRELATQPKGETPAAPQLGESEDVVPLFGYANAAGSVLRLNEDQRVGVVPIHPAQRGSRRAFAFITFGDSVSERLNHGDIGYAIWNRPPTRDKLALIELNNGETYVKIYMGQDANTLFARQLQPKKDVTFSLKDIAGLHAVVGASF